MDYLDKPDPQTFIAHHGIKGQKWGVRRFQNADGSLTKAGKERYNEQNSSDSSDNHENQKFHLTEKQKKYCKTVAIATGAAIVFDCQTRRVYDTPVKFSKILNQALANGIDSATLCRLDDKDLNLDLLRRWVKNS